MAQPQDPEPSVSEEKMNACVDCRFYCQDGMCIEPRSQTFDAVHGVQWRQASWHRKQKERWERDQKTCGYDGDWFAPKPDDRNPLGCIVAVLASWVIAGIVVHYIVEHLAK
jgi:hypothetical protein